MASRNSHSLPAPPGAPQTYSHGPPQPPQHQQQQQYYQAQSAQQQQQPQNFHQAQSAQQQADKPRYRSRAFSSRSDRSRKSGGGHEVDLHETSAEKESKRLHTKADPTLAMNEAEPSAVQANVQSSMAPLRSIQHRDNNGNPISEPDRSNPTRSRWERPLDTIRSFEAAIDGGYDNRKSVYRSDSQSVANFSRRSSYYANSGRFPQGSYYSSRPQSMFRPEDGQIDPRQGGMGQRDSYVDAHNAGSGGYPQIVQKDRQRYGRMHGEPQMHNPRRQDPSVYPITNNHRSYETVASASGSGSSGEPTGYQTDLTSSDNSSIERVQPPKQQRQLAPVNDYGIGFSQNNGYQPSTYTVGNNGLQQNRHSANGFAPPPPQKESRNMITRKPTNQGPLPAMQTQDRPDTADKRKSWFSRRFSKSS